MLAGLLFATQDAEDRAGTLAATLPFGGVTLIEYQARLLAGLGVSQIIVVVARLTPELLGAISRIGRRGVTIDAVRTAAEAAAKLHPLARILMLADGLVTTEAAIAPLAGEGGDALLVLDEGDASAVFERVGGRAVWAGVARISLARLAEVAAMPRDYDVESSLLRAAAQHGAAHISLAAGDIRSGHGIERRGDLLDARGRAVMVSTLSARRGWFDRWIVAPIAKPLLGEMMRRAIPTAALAGVSAVLAAAGLAAIVMGLTGVGVVLAVFAALTGTAGITLASLRDEGLLARALSIGRLALPALAMLLLGHGSDVATGAQSARILAVVLIVVAGLGERAAADLVRRPWWSGPPEALLVVASATLAGAPVLGLALAASYAAASLASTIEMLRRDA